MTSVHGLNPYADLPSAARNDPSWRLSNWHHLLSPYGPLFTLATSGLALLPLHAAYWTWKALVMLSAWGVLGLVAWTAPALGRSRARALALVGLNPLVLVYGLGGHHNEPLMLLSVVGAVALVVRAQTRRTGRAMERRRGGRRSRRRRPQALVGRARAADRARRAAPAGGARRGGRGHRYDRRGRRARVRRPASRNRGCRTGSCRTAERSAGRGPARRRGRRDLHDSYPVSPAAGAERDRRGRRGAAGSRAAPGRLRGGRCSSPSSRSAGRCPGTCGGCCRSPRSPARALAGACVVLSLWLGLGAIPQSRS